MKDYWLKEPNKITEQKSIEIFKEKCIPITIVRLPIGFFTRPCDVKSLKNKSIKFTELCFGINTDMLCKYAYSTSSVCSFYIKLKGPQLSK